MTARARYKKGMEALQRAKEEGKIGNPFAVSAAFAGVLGPAGAWEEPPPEVFERAWQRAIVELGLDHRPPDSEPPASGTRRRDASPAHDGEPPPSSRPPRGRSAWPRRLGPALLLLLGPGPARESGGDRPRDERPAVVLASTQATTIAPPALGASEPSPVSGSLGPGSVSTVVTTLPAASSTPPAPVRQRRQPNRGDNDAERHIMEEARLASARGDLPAAIDALTNHTRQFPKGQNAAARNRALSDVCALYRADHPQSDVPEMEKHCAGR